MKYCNSGTATDANLNITSVTNGLIFVRRERAERAKNKVSMFNSAELLFLKIVMQMWV
jgi:hypothetical protein